MGNTLSLSYILKSMKEIELDSKLDDSSLLNNVSNNNFFLDKTSLLKIK